MNPPASSTARIGAHASIDAGSEITRAQPLERRRLQTYLALMVGDIFAIFSAFCLVGYVYLNFDGLAQSATLAQLLLPVFLTVALYNGAYSLATLQSSHTGMVRAMSALGISAGAVVFIAYYTKSSATFSRVLFTAGTVLSAVTLCWLRLQMRAFVKWRCGTRIINELLIDDGGPRIALPGAMLADAARLGLVPALDDPTQLNRIGTLLGTIDRVVVTCPPNAAPPGRGSSRAPTSPAKWSTIPWPSLVRTAREPWAATDSCAFRSARWGCARGPRSACSIPASPPWQCWC